MFIINKWVEEINCAIINENPLTRIGTIMKASGSYKNYLKGKLPNTAKEILNSIIENPGISYNTLIRSTGKGNGTIHYHLNILEKQGMIISRKCGNKKRYSVDVKLKYANYQP